MGRAVILALLLALALPMGAAGAPAGGTPAAADAADVSVLTLNGTARSSFATASMDVATAMAVQHDDAATRLDSYALDERFEATPTTEARKTLLFEAATDVEIRIAALSDEERALRAGYADRDIDTATFVRRLARVHARAGQLRASLGRIQDNADEIPQFTLRRRVRLLDAALYGFEGPVRQRALAAMRGGEPPIQLYVGVSAQGAALSTVGDGRFVREAYRADNRDPETVGSISVGRADEIARQLYPDSYNSTNSIRTGIRSLSGGLYRIDIELREGLVTAYLDGATGSVFFEVQERRLDLIGPRPSAVGVANGTRLAVNRSYPGGPLRVSVADSDTGAPLQLPVEVDGARFRTSPDGVAWTVAPAGPFEVTAVGPAGNVTVSVRPLAPTPVNGEG